MNFSIVDYLVFCDKSFDNDVLKRINYIYYNINENKY